MGGAYYNMYRGMDAHGKTPAYIGELLHIGKLLHIGEVLPLPISWQKCIAVEFITTTKDGARSFSMYRLHIEEFL